MKKITEITKVLNSYGVIPTETDFNTKLKLLNGDASVYDYWGNKFMESNTCIKNANVLLQFKHSMVEKPFWIAIFHGGQYRSEEKYFVGAYWNKPFVNDALYKSNAINVKSKEDGVETILEIVDKFDRHFFSEDNEDLPTPLMEDNPDIVFDIAGDMESILCLEINIKKPLDTVGLETVEEVEKALERAKDAYQNNEGIKLLAEMLNNKDCPQMFKDLVSKYNINRVSFEEYVQNEDYMPDSGRYIVLEDKKLKNRFGFLFECTECYAEFCSPFEGTEFKNDEEFAEKLQEEEILVPEDEWTKDMVQEAFDAWGYIYSFSNEGTERKLLRR